MPVPYDIIVKQIDSIMSDIGADIVKIGMVYNQGAIDAICQFAQKYPKLKLIYDPVLTSSTKVSLIDSDIIDNIKKQLLPISYLLTPNLPEATKLIAKQLNFCEQINNADEVIKHQEKLLALGCKNILVKGGHAVNKSQEVLKNNNDKITDILISEHATEKFTHKKLNSKHVRGTGCSLASAIAANLVLGNDLIEAIKIAQKFVLNGIKNAPKISKTRGSIRHFS